MTQLPDSVRFLHDLVAIASVAPDEAIAVDLFITQARSLGMQAFVDEAGNAHALRATSETQSQPHIEIALLGHIDTVRGDIPVRIEHGILHGRGSVDAKGPLAAMLFAASAVNLPSNVTVRVIAAVGEETPLSPGARHLAQTLCPRACIIGEPSGWNGVTLGYKGRLIMHASLLRPSGHSAGPHGSASDAVVAFWQDVLAFTSGINAGHTGAFETIQASIRSLRDESDVMQDGAYLTAGFRLPSWMSPQQLELCLETIADRSRVTAHFKGHEHAFATDRNDPVVRALSCAIRAQSGSPHPKLKTGTSDMNVVAPIWNCPIAAYGPGDSSLDHTPTEHLQLDEYLRSINVLTKAIQLLATELTAPQGELSLAPTNSVS